jgi:hypothetical protein
LPARAPLVTPQDAAAYITALPKKEADTAEWQAAIERLMLVAEWAARQCLRASASCDREKVNEAVRDGIALGPLQPAGTADQYGVARARE